MSPVLYIIVPCFNEEDMLPDCAKVLHEKVLQLINTAQIDAKSRVVFIDDGSVDKTWDMIAKLSDISDIFAGIKLSKRFGHQNAVLSGLMTVNDKADIYITIDADLQDDVNAIDQMVQKFSSGAQIVYGVRKVRKSDTFFKRVTAQFFYKSLRFLGVNSVYNHADYRLISNKVLGELAKYQETNVYLRGIISNLGFKTDVVMYDRQRRTKGKSGYSLGRMLNLALDGITSFSIRPLRMVTGLGFIVTLAAVVFGVYLFIQKLLGGTPDGLSFIAISIWLVGGVQMLALGVFGEYLGKTYVEVKARPRYIIETMEGVE